MILTPLVFIVVVLLLRFLNPIAVAFIVGILCFGIALMLVSLFSLFEFNKLHKRLDELEQKLQGGNGAPKK